MDTWIGPERLGNLPWSHSENWDQPWSWNAQPQGHAAIPVLPVMQEIHFLTWVLRLPTQRSPHHSHYLPTN